MQVVEIKRPQEADGFACQDVGHKQSLHTDRNCCAASQDGQSTHRLHHLHLEVPPLGAHLDCHIAFLLVWLNDLYLVRIFSEFKRREMYWW